jgi:predicted dehydrogenase
LHHEYIARSVQQGCDVICEKPLTVDAEKCRAILETVKASGRNVRLTFNVRWQPGPTKIREMLQQGDIGQIKHVQMEWLLDYRHGGSYFQRWHSCKANSGGLLVHKATHHFDLVNWWIDGIPEQVFAMGSLAYYGRENALERGDEALTGYDRYTGAAGADDPFYIDLAADKQRKALYLDAEKDSGYIRDRNVFREDIDIEDVMSVMVKYRSGTTFSYHLNAFSPWKGYRVGIVGDRGRLEYEETYRPPVMEGENDDETVDDPATMNTRMRRLVYLPLFGKGKEIPIIAAAGGHGGGDPLIQEQMFSGAPPVDLYGRNAGHEQGAASAIIGIAANQSIATGQSVEVNDLISLRPEVTQLSQLV